MPPTNRPNPDPKTHARRVLRALERLYPDARCGLDHRNPFELLTATILSAQCTDAKVNQVAPVLFARFPDARRLAQAEPEQLEAIIHAAGFYRAKAKNLRGMAAMLVERHSGEVPTDLEALTALPGVGRKTANVVLGEAFGLAEGVVVDTHVKRLARRLGLTDSDKPPIIERDLMARFARKDWVVIGHLLITHGRRVCHARKPRCDECALIALCPRHGLPPLAEAPASPTKPA